MPDRFSQVLPPPSPVAPGIFPDALKWGERALEAAGAWNVGKSVILRHVFGFFCKRLWHFYNIMLYQIIMTNWVPQKTDCSKSHGKGETDEHYALVYLANLYFEAASHHKTLPAAKDPISHHFVCPCHPFKVLPTLKEPADQWCLCSLSRCTRNTFWTCYML